MRLVVLLLSVGIGMYYIRFLRRWDIHEPEPFLKMVLVTLWGGIWSIALALVTYHSLARLGITHVSTRLGPVLVIGPVEESAKLLALVSAYPFVRKDMNELTDGLLYMACVALGFSFIENYFYAMRSSAPVTILFLRILIATPMHIAFAAATGAAFYLVVRRLAKPMLLGLGLLSASLLHGLYDLILMNVIGLLVVGITLSTPYRWLIRLVEYSRAKSPFRKTLMAFLEDYEKPALRPGLQCLHCGSIGDKRTYAFRHMVLQKCDQCPCWVTTHDALFYAFHHFGSKLPGLFKYSGLAQHYRAVSYEGKIYSTLFEGNYVCDQSRLAFFYLEDLNAALEKMNRMVIEEFERARWFPRSLMHW